MKDIVLAYDITLVLDLFHGESDAQESLDALNILANALMQIDINYLRRHPETPNIYQSGVRYQAELEGQERWLDVPSVLRLGYGDCEDLSAWRAAELQVRQNILATPDVYVARRMPDGKYLYHVIVRMPNRDVEDPSFNLGMRSSHR